MNYRVKSLGLGNSVDTLWISVELKFVFESMNEVKGEDMLYAKVNKTYHERNSSPLLISVGPL